MGRPGAAPFRGGAKVRAVVANLVIAALGAVLAAAALLAVPADVTAVRVVGWYSVYAVLATSALAGALALTRQLPTVQEARLGDEDALVVRAWAGEWWHALALDLGLGVVGVLLMVLGVRAGAGWTVPGLLAGLLGAWFLVRVGLSLAGRRRNDALWLTAADVVHDSRSGRERVSRDQVRHTWAVDGTTYLLLVVAGARCSELCPLPWRPRRGAVRDDEIVMECSRLGHDVDALARWLQDQLGPSGPADR